MGIYCVRVDGTASTKASATGPISTPARCMSIATHNAETFAPGDKIIVGGQGGVIFDMLVPPSSGVTYQADDNRPRITGKAVSPNFTKAGDVYVADVADTVFDVFVYTSGDSAQAVLARNNTTATAPAAGQWGQEGGKLYIRLSDSSNPNGAVVAVTSPQAVNVVTKSDVVTDGLIIPCSAYHDWHGHLGGIVLNTGCNGCQIKNTKAAFSQHGLTVYSESVDCVTDTFEATDCFSAGVAIAQGFPNKHNTGSVLRNGKFLRCGLEGGGAFAVVTHGATSTGLVKDVLIENCEIVQGEGENWGHGLSLWHVDGATVKKCKISGFKKNGKDGISGAESAKNVKVENNIISNCYNGINISGEALVIGNYVKKVGYCCVRANKARGSIVNNTLDAENKGSGYPLAIWNGQLENVSNNIFARGKYSIRDMTTNTTIANFYNNNEFDCPTPHNITTITQSGGNIKVDPGVIDEEGRLSAGSPMIKAGVAIAGVTSAWSDFHGVVAGSEPNIGADQNKFTPLPPVPPTPPPPAPPVPAGNFSEWVPFDGTLPALAFAELVPARLKEVQVWSKLVEKKEIDGVPQ